MDPILLQPLTEDVQEALAGFLDRVAVGLFRSSVEGMLNFGNQALASIFGFDSVAAMRGYPLIRLYRSKTDRGDLINDLFRDGLVRNRRIEFQRRDGTPLTCSVSADAVLDADGNMGFIDGVLWEVSYETGRPPLSQLQQERLDQVRFQGVLEMAGGVVHRLNQPLTVATNLLNEMLSETAPTESHFDKLSQMREQIQKINEIAKKIGNIRQYKSMDYVAGVRIVDID